MASKAKDLAYYREQAKKAEERLDEAKKELGLKMGLDLIETVGITPFSEYEHWFKTRSDKRKEIIQNGQQ